MLVAALLLALSPDSFAQKSTAPEPICIESIIPRRQAEPDRWFAMDKFWHVSASFVTVGATYHLCANRLDMSPPWPTACALGATSGVGVAKEFYDLAGPTHYFSWKDLAADAFGIGVGYLAFIHRW